MDDGYACSVIGLSEDVRREGAMRKRDQERRCVCVYARMGFVGCAGVLEVPGVRVMGSGEKMEVRKEGMK